MVRTLGSVYTSAEGQQEWRREDLEGCEGVAAGGQDDSCGQAADWEAGIVDLLVKPH